MKIHSIRYGYAFNSSSTHSIIVTGRALRNNPPEEDGFGWSYFTAASPETKRRYAAAMLFENLPGVDGDYNLDKSARIAMAAALFGDPGEGEYDDYNGYVDHQSVIALPRRRAASKLPDMDFFRDFAAFLQRDDVAVLGGNDNSPGEAHPDSDASVQNVVTDAIGRLLYDKPRATVLCRRHGKHWVLFGSGIRMRMSFDDKAPELTKGDFPELVDLKITDFCPYGCDYCYQGSTLSGAHADMANITRIADSLRSLGTLEVAIGGGEPTLHPQFITILRMFKDREILPSFTTRNHKWFAGPYASETLQICGGIAFSVDTIQEAERWVNEIEAIGLKPECALQVVLGTMPIEAIEAVAQLCKVHHWTLSLLGFKHDHRGSSGPTHSIDGWERLLKVGCRVSVDTVIAEKQNDILANARVNKRLYGDREGQFSMYIDAVAMTMARASYDRVVRTPFGADRWNFEKQIASVFAKL